MSIKLTKSLILAATFSVALAVSPAHAAPFDKVETSATDLDLSTYQQVFLSPVEVNLKDRQTGALARLRAKRPAVSDSEADEKAEDLYQILLSDLGGQLELAAAPGPGVLTISPTITRLSPSRLNTVEGARNVSRDSIRSVTAGGAIIELTLSNADTTLVSIEDRYETTLNDGAPRITRWQDTDDAFARFSSKVERFLADN